MTPNSHSSTRGGRERVRCARLWVLAALLAVSACDEPSDPRQIDPASQEIRVALSANASVASTLHGGLRKDGENLFYSPLSIEAVLGMLYAGADGATAGELAALLGGTGDGSQLHAGLGALLEDLGGDHPRRGYELNIANRLFVQKGFPIGEAFATVTLEQYRAPAAAEDFAANPEGARSSINGWVRERTAGHVPELFRAGDIVDSTVVAVVNAIYFKGRWAHEFRASSTHSAPFMRRDGSSVQVPMMHSAEIPVRVGEMGSARVLELRYRGGDITFLALLPHSPDGLSALEAELKTTDLTTVAAQLTERELIVEMPRFELRTRIDLRPPLEALGVKELFDPARANLTKICPDQLFVQPLIHEAWVRVDEQGTEAAAATGGGVQVTSAPLPFRIDHPFLFFIRDAHTGAILFTGRIEDPSKTS